MPNQRSSAAAPLLVELFTEELPPKALEQLAVSFAGQVSASLAARGLLMPESSTTVFATPRRLAVRLSSVSANEQNKVVEFKGPSVKVAFDEQNQPTQALSKWVEKQGVTFEQLRRGSDGK